VLRVAYSRFYAPFGLSPDDLGLGYVELLAQAAIGAIILLLFFGLLTSIVVAMYTEVLTEPIELLESSLRTSFATAPGQSRRAGWGYLALLFGGMLALVSVLTGAPVVTLVLVCGVAVSVLVLTVRGIVRIRRGVAGGNAASPTPPRNPWRIGLVAATVLPALLMGATLIGAADTDADAVRQGRPVQPSLRGIPLTTWGAEAATLSWTSDAIDRGLRPLADACLMYLGQSDGVLFVYSPHALGRATFRVPANTAAVRIFPNAACHSGKRTPTR